jgi:two-component system sensor histidine kinase DegS
MIRREETRNADIATDLRHIQDNFDTVPREDIRSKYDEAMDARFRLATMRGQLEQFKAMQTQLNDEHAVLDKIIKKVQGGIELVSEVDPSTLSNQPNVNIVRVVQAQEDERRRLANQMHDGPAQSLTNFVLQAEICQRLFDRNPGAAAEELGNLKGAASVTFQKVRDFIFDLRPMMLDDLGVIPTVKRYVRSFAEKNDIEVKTDINGDDMRRLQEYQEVLIFRGIQEAMGHVRDFADASEISIQLDIVDNEARVKVEDNGRELDTSPLEEEGKKAEDPRIQGLLTLKEKFELINGELTADSDDENGTQIRITIPIRDRS